MTVRQLENRVAYLEKIIGINKDLIITIRDVASAVCQVYEVSFAEVKSKSRQRRYIDPRKMFCFLVHHYKLAGCVEAARILEKDHTTVIHLRNSVKSLLEVRDEQTVNAFLQCKNILETC